MSARMHRRPPVLGAVAAATMLGVVLVGAGPVGAGRPLDTEDTATVQPGKVELELAATWEQGSGDRSAAAQGALNVGIAPRLQVKIASGLGWLDPDDGRDHMRVTDTILGVKHRLLDETPRLPAILAAVTLRLPTGDAAYGLGQPGVDVGVLAVVSKAFGPLTLAWNGGYTFVTDDRAQDVVTLATSAETRVSESWTIVGEVFSQVAPRADEASVVLRAGAMYAITPSIRLDGAVGAEVVHQAPTLVVTVGVTIAF